MNALNDKVLKYIEAKQQGKNTKLLEKDIRKFLTKNSVYDKIRININAQTEKTQIDKPILIVEDDENILEMMVDLSERYSINGKRTGYRLPIHKSATICSI